VRTAFDKAGFSSISDKPLFISAVLQRTFVELNEEGTEAVAAKGLLQRSGIAWNPPKPFRMVDRPFLFLIEDEEMRTILFMGIIFDPGAASGSQANGALTGPLSCVARKRPRQSDLRKTYTVAHSTNIPETPLHTGVRCPGLVPLRFQERSFSALRGSICLCPSHQTTHSRSRTSFESPAILLIITSSTAGFFIICCRKNCSDGPLYAFGFWDGRPTPTKFGRISGAAPAHIPQRC